MGLFNRTYWKTQQGGYRETGYSSSGLTYGLPRPSTAVKVLLIVNIAVFIVQMLLGKNRGAYDLPLMNSLLGVTVSGWWQVWRYITFQFLHADGWHIFLNMLAVYMLGTPLEQHWGTWKFTKFYLGCGAVAGLAYVIIGFLFNLPPEMPIIGASGGVYAIILACAVLFPHFQLIVLLFPLPIRIVALGIFALMIFNVLSSLANGQAGSAMSDVAHLGGAAAAAVYLLLPRLREIRPAWPSNPNPSGWARKLEMQQKQQAEIDRILAKISQQGLASLSRKEKKTLQDATDRQNKQEQELRRM